MMERYGIIFLDGNEIVIRIYQKDPTANWQLVRYQTNDLTTFTTKKTIDVSEIIEIIAQVSLSQYGLHVLQWKICGRNIPENLLHDVSVATSIQAEMLTLVREQELICKGILVEIQ